VGIARLVDLYGDRDEWKPKAISSVAGSGMLFERTIIPPSARGYLGGSETVAT
jgi:hypothetical protein